MREQNNGSGRFARFAFLCVSGAVCALFFILFVSGLFWTVHVHVTPAATETADITSHHPLSCLLAVCLFAGLLAVLFDRIRKCRVSYKRGLFFSALWFFLAAAFVVANGLQQLFDYQTVLQAAERAASGSYSIMESEYFNSLSYQLPMVFSMELLVRIFPWIHLNRAIQILNIFASLVSAWGLAAIASILFNESSARATLVLFLLSMPSILYCTFAYGTLFMVCLDVLGACLFLMYDRENKPLFGVLSALLVGLACMMKYNGLIFAVAYGICCALSILERRRILPLVFAVLCFGMTFLCTKGVIRSYELRSGVRLRGDISTQARLVMGLQEGGPAAGWYNNYILPFFEPDLSREEERRIVQADLENRLTSFRSNPGYAARFFSEKTISQWLDPTYGGVRYGQMCPHSGNYWQSVWFIYDESGPFYAWLQGYMKLYQMSLYLFAVVGLVKLFCGRSGSFASSALLPTAIFGGFLYHLLFEAKSHYVYPYVLYLLPFAGVGLCSFAGWAGNFGRRLRHGQNEQR